MQKYVIVVDVQNDFVNGALANSDAQKKIPAIVDFINSQPGGTTFIYTLDTHEKNYMESLEGQKLPVPHCIRDTPGWELKYEVGSALQEKMRVGEKVQGVLKETFGSVDLMNYFKDKRAQEHDIEIEVVGFCTDICVLSTVILLRAALPNTKITCHANLCSGVTKELHDAAIAVMKSCQIDVEGEE